MLFEWFLLLTCMVMIGACIITPLLFRLQKHKMGRLNKTLDELGYFPTKDK